MVNRGGTKKNKEQQRKTKKKQRKTKKNKEPKQRKTKKPKNKEIIRKQRQGKGPRPPDTDFINPAVGPTEFAKARPRAQPKEKSRKAE